LPGLRYVRRKNEKPWFSRKAVRVPITPPILLLRLYHSCLPTALKIPSFTASHICILMSGDLEYTSGSKFGEDLVFHVGMYSRDGPDSDKRELGTRISWYEKVMYSSTYQSSPSHPLLQGYPHPSRYATIHDHKDTILVSAL
jgi:hypothetical protein